MSRPDSRSPLAVATQWASKITSVGLEFALPPLFGVLVDRWLGIFPVVTLIGTILGFAIGLLHILRIAREGTTP